MWLLDEMKKGQEAYHDRPIYVRTDALGEELLRITFGQMAEYIGDPVPRGIRCC